MNDFRFSVSTEILFGKDQLEKLPEVIGRYGKKVLLTYGGGSIKRIGLYDKVKELLKDFEIFELGGIDPNPRIESVYEGTIICKENNIDVILPVGGGSTIDCSKVIAAATLYDNDAWDLVKDPSKIKDALPICTVLTLAATGSEMNGNAVISSLDTNEKLGLGSEHLLPKTSFLDPENTFSVPKKHTAAGVADILSHIFEVYFSTQEAYVPDRIAEGLIKTLIKYGPIAYNEPENYEARAEIMWAGTLAINGICSTGKGNAWTCHPIEHELSAYYDITHGIGLAIITPNWMKYVLNDNTVDKFAEYALNVWNVEESEYKYEMAEKGIEKTKEFLKSLGIPMSLKEVDIDDEYFENMSKHAVEIGNLTDAYVPLDEEDVKEILEMSL